VILTRWFRCINDLPYARKLVNAADRDKPPGEQRKIVRFLQTLDGLLAEDDPERDNMRTALGHYQPVRMRALSIRQPHAEAILRGVKKIEYRSRPTSIRGWIHIYAGKGRYSAEDEAEMMADYGIRGVTCDDLPRGVLVGTVDKLVPPRRQDRTTVRQAFRSAKSRSLFALACHGDGTSAIAGSVTTTFGSASARAVVAQPPAAIEMNWSLPCG